jgi:Transposase DDE domain
MERELWPLVYRALRRAAREVTQKYVQYHPWVIAAVLLWAALHDRPVCWACDPRNWSTTRLRPPELPAAATVSRRAARAGFAVFLNHLAARLKGDGPPGWELTVDGKPLPVGHCSKDPDARGTPLGRGYKLHAIWGDRAWPEAWAVTALRDYEGAVAEQLLTQVSGKGVLLADGNYEASRVYDAAAASGYQLLAPPDPGDNGAGHRYQSPHRRVALGWFRDGLGWDLYRERASIERMFGNAGSFGGGLGPLPNWARRQGRVERWVWCKLVINAHRITYRRLQKERLQ